MSLPPSLSTLPLHSPVSLMSGATELLALTEAAIEPLFHTGQQTTGDGIDGTFNDESVCDW